MSEIEKKVEDALLQLADAIEHAPNESSFGSRAEQSLAYLHAHAFAMTPTTTIAAIEFVSRIREIVHSDVSGIDDKLYDQFVPLIQASDVALSSLCDFVDIMRTLMKAQRFKSE